MASLNTADGKHWAAVLNLFSQGHSYAHIAAKMAAKTGEKWSDERVRSIVRHARTSPNNAGIPPLGDKVTGDLLKGEKKILVLSDLHAPHTLPIVDHIVQEHAGWDGIDLNGDIFDNDYVSSHSSGDVALMEEEFRYLHPRLKKWEEMFPHKRIRPGNHEWRLARYLDKRIDRGVKWLFKKVSDPIRILLDGFELPDGKEYAPLTGWTYTPWWWSQYGDALVAHPGSYLSLPMKTVYEMDAWFRDWNIAHRLLVIGHTHKAGMYWSDSFPKRLMIESGCLCRTMDYQVSKGKRNYKPQSVGYVEMFLWNGEVDMERTRQVQVC